jgi:hypothetical protein
LLRAGGLAVNLYLLIEAIVAGIASTNTVRNIRSFRGYGLQAAHSFLIGQREERVQMANET